MSGLQCRDFDKIFKDRVWFDVVTEYSLTPILICRNANGCRIDLHLAKRSTEKHITKKLGFIERVSILKAMKSSLLPEGFIDQHLPDMVTFGSFTVDLSSIRGPTGWSSPAKDVTAVVFESGEYQLTAKHGNGILIEVPNFEAIVYSWGEVEMLDAP